MIDFVGLMNNIDAVLMQKFAFFSTDLRIGVCCVPRSSLLRRDEMGHRRAETQLLREMRSGSVTRRRQRAMAQVNVDVAVQFLVLWMARLTGSPSDTTQPRYAAILLKLTKPTRFPPATQPKPSSATRTYLSTCTQSCAPSKGE